MDPSGFIRPRAKDGTWANPTSAGPVATWRPELQDGYQEATAYQALWAEPQDVAGLAAALGGRQAAVDRLDRFFSTALQHPASPAVPAAQQYASFFGVYYIGNQYTPANETDLWAPWYYDWLGEPSKTQQIVRAAMSVYNARPDGLPGNDDAGTMSAWYVLAALGLYHAAPGSASWQLSSPAFSHVEVRRPGRPVTIDAPGASSASAFIDAATLGGRPLDRAWLSSCELLGGAQLAFTLAPSAGSEWATGPGAAPPSLSDPVSRRYACAQGTRADR
jgi:putative alpha-1,2-mannosidase